MGDITDGPEGLAASVPTDKVFLRGTHRTRHPEATEKVLQRWLPVLGITRVANVTGLDHVGLPVVMVCRPNARSLSVSQGKGLTLAAAKASGIMESLELYHGERVQLPLERASWREISLRRPMIDIAGLRRPKHSLFHPDRRLLWIEGKDLQQGEAIWVPFETVHMDLSVPLPDGSGCFFQSSNGLASGNHHLEAICHGLCEVIERDALARWLGLESAQRQATALDLDSIEDADCRLLLERFAAAGLRVAVWDVTSNLGIPAFHCELAEQPQVPWRRVGICRGQGCHLSPTVALIRALTEAAQARLTYIAGSRDDLVPNAQRHRRQPDGIRRWHASLDANTSLLAFDRVDLSSKTFQTDVDEILERLISHGFPQAAMIDLTQPGLQIPVIRVVVPGLLNALH